VAKRAFDRAAPGSHCRLLGRTAQSLYLALRRVLSPTGEGPRPSPAELEAADVAVGTRPEASEPRRGLWANGSGSARPQAEASCERKPWREGLTENLGETEAPR